eukprot:IDg4502t1
MRKVRLHLITALIEQSFMNARATQYSGAMYEKAHALLNCVRFINGTMIGIARPKWFEVQRVAYSEHQRKHALKYIAVSSPDRGRTLLHIWRLEIQLSLVHGSTASRMQFGCPSSAFNKAMITVRIIVERVFEK